jgi:hypothetical protein
MTGRKILFGALLIAALAIIAVLWGMHLEALQRLRDQENASRQLLSRLGVLEVDNLRLSNIVVQANTPLAADQLAELAKLRLEVQQLRHRTNDLQTMKTEIRRLRTELANARNVITSNAPPDVPAEDIFPRDSWTFAGYDTPEAAIESVNWAIGQGNEEAYLASLSPELQDAMQSELADGSFADSGPLEMGNATGFRILDREAVSDNEIVITVYMDGDGNEIPLVLTQTADGWKVSGNLGD